MPKLKIQESTPESLGVDFQVQQHQSEVLVDILPLLDLGISRIRLIAPKGYGLVDGWIDNYKFCATDLSNWSGAISQKVTRQMKMRLLDAGISKASSYYRDFYFAPTTYGAAEMVEVYCPLSLADAVVSKIKKIHTTFPQTFASENVKKYWGKDYAALEQKDKWWADALCESSLVDGLIDYEKSLSACLFLLENYTDPDPGFYRWLRIGADIGVRETNYSSMQYIDVLNLDADMRNTMFSVKCLRALLLYRMRRPYFYGLIKSTVSEIERDAELLFVAKRYEAKIRQASENISYFETLCRCLSSLEEAHPILLEGLDLPK